MKIGYIRVCNKDEYAIEKQKKQLEQHGATKIYIDIASGISSKRKELNKLLKQSKKGDTIVVTSIFRLARSYETTLSITKKLIKKDLNLEILDSMFAEHSNKFYFKLIGLGLEPKIEQKSIDEYTEEEIEYIEQ